jgi:NAD(P)-dependent dehydrogenase (short-subunit alcohol dehydrogenase family)
MGTNWNEYLSRDYSTEFSGEHVIVAGGAQGIGEHLTSAFRWLGAKVSVWDKNAPVGCAHSENFQSLRVDLVNKAEREEALEKAVKHFDLPPRVFISTVGLDSRIPLEKLDEDKLGEQLAVNFTAPVLAARDVMTSMRDGIGGAVCLFTSLHGSGLYESDAFGYGAAKAALNHSIVHLAQVAGETNTSTNIIRVFGFCPGWVQTDNQRRFDDDEFEKARVKQLAPLPLLPQDMVAPVLFLVSNRAPFFTGEIFQFTGGERNFRKGPAGRSGSA